LVLVVVVVVVVLSFLGAIATTDVVRRKTAVYFGKTLKKIGVD
jgi:hypothetical protein